MEVEKCKAAWDSWVSESEDRATWLERARSRTAWIKYAADRLGIPLTTFGDEKPGTPLAEHFNEIAAKLKEIETERQKERQAAEIPEEKN